MYDFDMVFSGLFSGFVIGIAVFFGIKSRFVFIRGIAVLLIISVIIMIINSGIMLSFKIPILISFILTLLGLQAFKKYREDKKRISRVTQESGTA